MHQRSSSSERAPRKRLRLRALLTAVSAGSLAVLACGHETIDIDSDAGSGLGTGSSASTSNGGSSSDNAGTGGRPGELDAAAPDANLGMPCSTSADCIDQDLCNGTEACVLGQCHAGSPLSCSDGDPCTADRCQPATGVCSSPRLPNGSPCQDDNLCDGQTCLEGVCTAGPIVLCLDDGSPCTSEACDPKTGACTTTAAATGTPCEDGNHCNGFETCNNGVCIAGSPPDCDDLNPCTSDVCDAAAGCLNTTLSDGTSCSDGNLCNGVESCILGTCVSGAPPSCDDSNFCTLDTCNPATGACTFSALPDSTPCPDGNLCDGQLCLNGACLDGPDVVCPADTDNNVCTANACVPATGRCAQGNVANGTPCIDANVCDGTETCQNGACSAGGTPLSCPQDNNPCTVETCDPAFGCRVSNAPNGTSCADADLCDGQETCTAGVCSGSGMPVACDDGNPCTANSCNPVTGGCVFTPVTDGTSCADADLCDGSETCTAGVCSASGTPLVCDDGNACTSNACVPATGCLFTPAPDGTTCADADLCDGAETCTSGVCSGSGTPVACNDGNPCTSNSCNPATGGCVFPPVSDGTSCADADLCDGSETCTSGVCSASGTPIVCEDNNPCTTNSCVPATGGCVFASVVDGTSCADTDLCNGAEACTTGVCLAGTPVSCTAPQSCIPATGACGP